MVARAGMNDEEKALVSDFMAAIAPFKALNPTMSLQSITTFMTVAAEQGLGVGEYARRAGVNSNRMTRYLQDLCKFDRHRQPGLNLVMQTTDPNDRRGTLTYLTPEGYGVLSSVVRAMKRSRK